MKQEIREELLSLQRHDIAVREELVKSGELFNGYSPKMEAIHKENAAQLRKIIAQVGWPGKDTAGEDGAYAAWFILQHDIGEPDFVRSCVPLLQKAAEEGQLPKKFVAMTIDRTRIYEGKQQIYGTHYDWDDDGQISPVSLENREGVDARRATMDLPPLDENIKRIREEAEKEGQRPPADIAAYRKKAEDWYRSAGWRN